MPTTAEACLSSHSSGPIGAAQQLSDGVQLSCTPQQHGDDHQLSRRRLECARWGVLRRILLAWCVLRFRFCTLIAFRM
jgi:hypothetical protein